MKHSYWCHLVKSALEDIRSRVRRTEIDEVHREAEPTDELNNIKTKEETDSLRDGNSS